VGAVGNWSEQMMTQSADHMELISEHFYNRSKNDLLEHVRQIPNNVKRIADAHRDYRKRFDSLKGKDIRIALDEWNYWYGTHAFGELGTRYFMQDALGIAAGLHEYFRNSDIIFMANYAQTVNVIGCIKTTKTAATLAATGLPLWLYRNHFGVTPVAIEGDYGNLDIAAAWTEDKKKLTVGIVNATMEKHWITLDVQGADLSGGGIMYIIEHEDRMAYNEPGKKPQIAINKYAIFNAGKLISPPISIVVYELPVK
jgi:alpha-N-arabinofuranosidase